MLDDSLHLRKERYRILVYNDAGEFVSDALVGPTSLVREFDFMPVGWKISVLRINDDEEGRPQ